MQDEQKTRNKLHNVHTVQQLTKRYGHSYDFRVNGEIRNLNSEERLITVGTLNIKKLKVIIIDLKNKMSENCISCVKVCFQG